MKLFRIFIWSGFLLITAAFWYCGRLFSEAGVPGIISFEFANAVKGKVILHDWQQAGLLPHARNLISWDFVYIFFYVALIITLSNHRVRKEPSVLMNALLRSSFFFAVLAGFFDVIENTFLLYNISHYNDLVYLSSYWITSAKFICIAWAFLVWFLSLVKSLLSKMNYTG